MQKRLQALGSNGSVDFWRNEEPVCPHCGVCSTISENEWWKLYAEGEHEVTCPSCDEDFTVTTNVTFSFSTDVQDDE